MDIDSNSNGNSSQAVVSTEERIRDLNVLDQEIVQMLASMGRAVQVMTVRDDEPLTLEQRRETFRSSVQDAVSRLVTIDVGQRRSIYALAEAGIIESDSKSGLSKTAASRLGSLDVSILNSQNDRVGKEFENEQWAKVREILQKLQETTIT